MLDVPAAVKYLLTTRHFPLVVSSDSDAETNLSPHIHLSHLVCEAIRLVLTQFLLKDMKLGVVEGQYVLSPASAICLFVMSAFVEMPTMLQTGDYRALHRHVWEFVAVSLCGLVINFLSYFVIQLTSSLTLKVLVSYAEPRHGLPLQLFVVVLLLPLFSLPFRL